MSSAKTGSRSITVHVQLDDVVTLTSKNPPFDPMVTVVGETVKEHVGGVGVGALTVNDFSVDAGPVPQAFFAFTRAKYVPGVKVTE